MMEIQYEGNKLEDFINKYLSVYKKKETDKEELEKMLSNCLKEIELLSPDEVKDEMIENILKTLMSKKFVGEISISITMLSELLALRLPDHFTLIDFRVLEATYKLGRKEFFPKELKPFVLKKWHSMRYENNSLKKITKKDYINYLKIVKGIKRRIREGAPGTNVPLEDIERALYAYNKYPPTK